MIRALARDLGREDQIEGVRVPRHEPGPPETLTDNDYANLLRVPDRRTLAGKRDYALLRVLGDCGLRPAELRGLRARDLRQEDELPAGTSQPRRFRGSSGTGRTRYWRRTLRSPGQSFHQPRGRSRRCRARAEMWSQPARLRRT
jgi:integrase